MGAVFALYSAWYFWIPKILGVDYNKSLSKTHFWTLFAGVNITFFPQHFLGLQGMPRRISDYPDAFAGWNMVSSMGSLISVIATGLFLHILYVQLVVGKATSRYLWLRPEFYYDLLQTLLSRVYNSLEWGLNSPPKPHAFVSLPLQSSLFNFFTKRLNKHTLTNMLVCVGLTIAYRIPMGILLQNLGLQFYYPLVASILAVLTVIIINNMLEKNSKYLQYFIVGAIAFSIAMFVYLLKQYTVESELYQKILGLLAGNISVLYATQGGGAGAGGGSSTKNSSSPPNGYVIGGPMASTGKNHSAIPGSTGGESSSAGSISGGIGASSSGSGSADTRTPTVSQEVRPEDRPEGSKRSITTAQWDQMMSNTSSHLRNYLFDPQHLMNEMKASILDALPSKFVPDSIKSDIAQEAQTKSPKIIGIPASIRKEAMDYWHFKNVNSKATLELEIAKIIKERVHLPEPERTAFNEKLFIHNEIVSTYKTTSFHKMKLIYDKNLNHQDRKTIKKHMPGFVTGDTSSDRKDS